MTYATINDPVVYPVISSVCLEVRDDVVVAQAYGGFRAAYRSERVPGAGTWRHAVLLRSEQLDLAARVLAGCGQVTLEVNQGMHQRTDGDAQPADEAPRLTTERVTFIGGNTTVEIAPLDGMFPDIRHKLLERSEQSIQTRALCSTRALQEALEDLLPAVQRTLFVRLHIGPEILRVEAPAGHRRTAVERRVDLLAGVEFPSVADFHCQALLETLRALEGAGEIRIELAERPRLGFFRSGTGESTHAMLPFDPDYWFHRGYWARG